MPIGELCSREVVVVNRDEPIREAVRLMRQHHIGDVIVVETRNGHRRPVGIRCPGWHAWSGVSAHRSSSAGHEDRYRRGVVCELFD